MKKLILFREFILLILFARVFEEESNRNKIRHMSYVIFSLISIIHLAYIPSKKVNNTEIVIKVQAA